MAAPEIFDRTARRLRRDRAMPDAFLSGQIVETLLDRLDAVRRIFRDALVVGAEPALIDALRERGMTVSVIDPGPRRAAASGATCADEDALAIGESVFDLVIAAGTLDTVDDLPGALILMRRALQPDGLLLAGFLGGALPALRAAVAQADGMDGQAVARFHPRIDARAAGDLLVRAGFALPVADVETLDLSYTGLGALLADLRAAGATNALKVRCPVTRRWLAEAAAAFAASTTPDGRVHEQISIVVLTGWAPAPDQPKPAARGSATASLSTALRRRG